MQDSIEKIFTEILQVCLFLRKKEREDAKAVAPRGEGAYNLPLRFTNRGSLGEK
jgi:hypothetical protein